MKNKKYVFFFIIIFLFSFIFSEPLIPASSFKQLESHIPHFFSLNEKKYEAYFKFKNSDNSKDLIINLALGIGYDVFCYAYLSNEDIQIKDNQYYNYLFNFTLDKKELYFTNLETKIYYFICVNYIQFFYDDYITIFNEADEIKLEHNNPFNIYKFYSSNSYIFLFEGKKNEIINIQLNSKNKTFNQLIKIFIDDEEQKSIRDTKINITYNSDLIKASTYKIQILSEEEKYSENIETIIIYKMKRKVSLLEQNSNIALNYIFGNIYNFYVNINEYNLNEEGLITFKYSSYGAQKKMFSYIYGKIVKLEKDSDDLLIQNMPSSNDNEFQNENYENLDTIYQMYFNKFKNNEVGKILYLLIQIKLDDKGLYFQSENFTISLSERIKKIQFLNNETVNKKEQIHLKNYVPHLYSFKFPKQNKYSYILYVNNTVAKIYNGTLIINKMINTKNIKKQLYAISKEINDLDLYTIQIFGYEQDIEIRIETIESQIFYLRDLYRPIKSFSNSLLNYKESFYYIGDYDISTKVKYLYIEELFGKFNIYYKNEILKDDESILTKSNQKYLIDTKIPLLYNHIDIIEVKCRSPGYFNLYLLSDFLPNSFSNNGRLISYLHKKRQYHLRIIENDNMNLELLSPLGNEIKIQLNDENILLNQTNKIKRFEQITQEYNDLTIFSNEDSLIEIKIANKNLFKKISKEDKSINEKYILFELEKKNDYKAINLSFQNILYGYSYYLLKGNSDFASDPKTSTSFDIIEESNFKIELTNPYDKFQPNNIREDDIFYFALVTNQNNPIEINIVYLEKEKYFDLKEKENTILSPSKNKININVNNDEVKNLNIFSTICKYDSIKKMILSYYDKEFIEFYLNKKKIEYLSINNPMISIQIETQFISNDSYSGAEISYFYGDLDISKIEDLNKLNLEINNSSNIITWKAIEGYTVSYEFYYFDIENKDSEYIENDCFLKSMKDNKTNNKNLKEKHQSGIYKTNKPEFKFEKNGKFKINVVAIINEISIRLIYKSKSFDLSSIEKKSSYKWIIFIIIALVIIFLVSIYYFHKRSKMNYSKILDEVNFGDQLTY